MHADLKKCLIVLNKIRDAEEEVQIQLTAVDRLFRILESKMNVAKPSEKTTTGVADVSKDTTKTSGKTIIKNNRLGGFSCGS